MLIPVTKEIWLPERALYFPAGSTNRVNHGAALDAILKAKGSMAMWVIPRTFTASATFVRCYDSGATQILVWSLTGAGIQFSIVRSIQSQNMTCTFAQAGFYNARPNEPRFCVAQWDNAGANADQRLYFGSLTEPMKEADGYSPQRPGSGTIATTQDSIIGNSLAGAGPLEGSISVMMAYNRFLTLAEWDLVRLGNPPRDGMVLYALYGDEGGNTAANAVQDLSGSGFHGTITGATVTTGPADYARRLFQFQRSRFSPLNAYTMTMGQGSYTLTGQAMLPKASRLLTATQGSYALTGQAVALKAGRLVTAAQGSYALTGQAVLLKANRLLTVAQGSYNLAGQAVVLTYSGASGPTHTLSMGQGSYALTGQALTLKAARQLALAQGSYALNGQAVLLKAGRKLTATQGSYLLTGQTLGFRASRVIPMATGFYAVSGQSLTLAYSGATSLGDLIETSTNILALPYSTSARTLPTSTRKV